MILHHYLLAYVKSFLLFSIFNLFFILVTYKNVFLNDSLSLFIYFIYQRNVCSKHPSFFLLFYVLILILIQNFQEIEEKNNELIGKINRLISSLNDYLAKKRHHIDTKISETMINRLKGSANFCTELSRVIHLQTEIKLNTS